MTELQRIGGRIRKLRHDRDLTQIKLSELSGLSQPTISATEKGRHTTLHGLIAIAKALDVTLAEIVE